MTVTGWHSLSQLPCLTHLCSRQCFLLWQRILPRILLWDERQVAVCRYCSAVRLLPSSLNVLSLQLLIIMDQLFFKCSLMLDKVSLTNLNNFFCCVDEIHDVFLYIFLKLILFLNFFQSFDWNVFESDLAIMEF